MLLWFHFTRQTNSGSGGRCINSTGEEEEEEEEDRHTQAQ